MARILGISMELVSIDPMEQPSGDKYAGKIIVGGYTVPDLSTSNSFLDTVKCIVAGLAAMRVMGVAGASDESNQPDFIDAVDLIKSKRNQMPNPPSDETVPVWVRGMVDLVAGELSKPNIKAALIRCTDYLLRVKTIKGIDTNDLLDSFFKPLSDSTETKPAPLTAAESGHESTKSTT